MGEDVLDMSGLDKLEASALDERNVAPLQLQFEIEGVKARAEQHRDFRKLDAFLAKLEAALRDEARLHVLIGGAHQHRAEFALTFGEQHLGIALGGARNQFVGDIEDALNRAIVLFELDDARVRKNFRKV